MTENKLKINNKLRKYISKIIDVDPEKQMQKRLRFINNHLERVKFIKDNKPTTREIINYDKRFVGRRLW